MKKIKLMQIIPSLNSGGAEQGAIDVANFIGNKNVLNFIISNGGKMIKHLNRKYVTHCNLPVHSKNFFKMPFTAKKINSLITANNINILHFRSRAPAWMLPYIEKKNIKTVSTFHNLFDTKNIIKKIYNKGLSKSDYIVAISKYVGKEIVSQYNINPKKIKIINRGIDVNFFNSANINKINFINFNKKINLPNNKKIILYPGRVTEWKGQIEFLNIVERFKNESITYFVGDTKNLNYTKKLFKEIYKRNLNNSCKVLDHLDKEELKILYHCSDVVISAPSKGEGFGRIVSESLAMKKIILAYNFGGAGDQIKDLDNIYKIKPFDQEELSNKIKIVFESFSSEKFKNILEHSRNHVVKNFNSDIMLQGYLNLYEEICS